MISLATNMLYARILINIQSTFFSRWCFVYFSDQLPPYSGLKPQIEKIKIQSKHHFFKSADYSSYSLVFSGDYSIFVSNCKQTVLILHPASSGCVTVCWHLPQQHMLHSCQCCREVQSSPLQVFRCKHVMFSHARGQASSHF